MHVGISQGFHDAGLSIISNNGEIMFAAHAERYSQVKNDRYLNDSVLQEAKKYLLEPYDVNYYERPFIKNLRRLYSGQKWETHSNLKKKLFSNGFSSRLVNWPHHLSHAASAFQTSPYSESAVVIVDAVGEWDTVSIWKAHYDLHGHAKYKKLWSRMYPHSIGLFYTAMTERIGLRPMEDEYVLMGMAAYGNENLVSTIKQEFVENLNKIKFTKNMHLGIGSWLEGAEPEDLACSTQAVTEEMLLSLHKFARDKTGCNTVCFGGGVALNCSFNYKLRNVWDGAWIFPNPGDCGSSLGAAALGYGKRLNWASPFLGYNIEGELNVNAVVDELMETGMVGVANGRAEFGPRALGNRSLLGNPKFNGIKDIVNDIKRRQRYRPFAPAILAEYADEWFDVDSRFTSEYMQYAVRAKKAAMYPAICHVDGTARVQTVPKNNSNIRKVLELFYQRTGCPILLNTSLNIRGKPMVNDVDDAKDFQSTYGVKVVV